jgi:cation diffusion facilitator family transporter
MHPQRRTALISVLAAVLLVAIKLLTGLATGSLGLVSEALHSGTDLVAALLTFFAVGVAIRPADPGHQYGHGKAEHLAALGEGAILAVASGVIVVFAVLRLTGVSDERVEVTWYAFAVVFLVMAIDVSRMVVSARAAQRFRSEALRSNAIHFGSDRGAGRARRGGGRLSQCGLAGGALRGCAGAPRGEPAHAPQRGRAHGPRAGGGG